MHIAPYDNQNRPSWMWTTPCAADLLQHREAEGGRAFRLPRARLRDLRRPGHRHGDGQTGGETFAEIGNRGVDVWDGEPEGVYVPTDTGAGSPR
jgi:5-deoxy-glucuronate isomerase